MFCSQQCVPCLQAPCSGCPTAAKGCTGRGMSRDRNSNPWPSSPPMMTSPATWTAGWSHRPNTTAVSWLILMMSFLEGIDKISKKSKEFAKSKIVFSGNVRSWAERSCFLVCFRIFFKLNGFIFQIQLWLVHIDNEFLRGDWEMIIEIGLWSDLFFSRLVMLITALFILI